MIASLFFRTQFNRYVDRSAPTLHFFLKKPLNQSLGLLISPFSDTNVTNQASFINEIHRGSVAVAVPVPRSEIVVDGDEISNVLILQIVSDFLHILFVRKLRRMDSDNHQALVCILLMPLFHLGFDVATVVAAECPELHKYDLAFQFSRLYRSAIEPNFIGNRRGLLTNHSGSRRPTCEEAHEYQTRNDSKANRHATLPSQHKDFTR